MSKAIVEDGFVKVQKVTFVKSGNVKLGKMWVWNTLKGADVLKVDYRGMQFNCVGTCGKVCKTCGCSDKCYVNKSYNRYPSVKYGHAINTLALRKSVAETFKQLYKQLFNARNKPEFVRIHSSGEFETLDEIKLFNNLAYHFPQVTFYTYSKNYDLWDDFLTREYIQPNFVLNVSIWHESGIDFYNKWKHLPNVKAFVFDDGFNYASHCLEIQTHCTAYDTNGKMNHAVTCDKCRKCMNCNENVKVVGCYEH